MSTRARLYGLGTPVHDRPILWHDRGRSEVTRDDVLREMHEALTMAEAVLKPADAASSDSVVNIGA